MLSEAAEKIADEAIKQGMWIYSPAYKKWYSPEDFKHIFSYADAKEEFLNQLQIRNPLEGLEAGFKQVNDLQTRLSSFAKMVFKYYKK